MRTLWMVVVCFAVVGLGAAPVRAGPEDGRTAHKGGDPEQALERWKPLAERGEREAQFRLGEHYEKGEGVKRNLAEAHKWYVLAWKRKHPDAQEPAVALRKRMTKPQFQDSRRRIRAWIKGFDPAPSDGVTGPERGGLRLVQRETSRKKIKGVTHVCYVIEAAGIDRAKKYRIWQRTVGMMLDDYPEEGFPSSVAFERLEKIDFCFKDFMKGEWSRVKVTSADGTILAQTTFIPFPLEARQGRCRIWLQLMSRTGAVFLAQGEGFDPGEEVTTVSRSNGEVIRGKAKTDAEGKLGLTLLAPAAVQRKHKSSLSVIRKSGKLTIHYEWGRPALRIQ